MERRYYAELGGFFYVFGVPLLAIGSDHGVVRALTFVLLAAGSTCLVVWAAATGVVVASQENAGRPGRSRRR